MTTKEFERLIDELLDAHYRDLKNEYDFGELSNDEGKPTMESARTALLSAFDEAARPEKMTRQEAEILVKSLAPTIEQCSKAGDVKQLWKAVQEVTNIEEKIIAAMTS